MSVPADPDKVKYDSHSQAMGHAYNDRERGVYLPYDLVAAIGGWTQAVVYKHIAYWFTKMGRPIYKSAPELAEELHLSESTVKRAVAELRGLGLITTEVRKANSVPTNHFRVHYKREAELLSKWRNGRPDGPGQNDPMGRVKMERSLTESTNREYKQENPSSTFVDVSASKSTSSAKEASESPSSLTVEPGSGAKLMLELIEIWNQHRGRLPSLRNLNDKRARLLARLIKEARAAKLDPREVVKAAALEVANDPHYIQGRYTLENIIQSKSNRLGRLIDRLVDEGDPDSDSHLRVGDRVSWQRRLGTENMGRVHGVITGFDERGAPIAKVTSAPAGYGFTELAVNPAHLRVEDSDE